jgi:hypothetical protein
MKNMSGSRRVVEFNGQEFDDAAIAALAEDKGTAEKL